MARIFQIAYSVVVAIQASHDYFSSQLLAEHLCSEIRVPNSHITLAYQEIYDECVPGFFPPDPNITSHLRTTKSSQSSLSTLLALNKGKTRKIAFFLKK